VLAVVVVGAPVLAGPVARSPVDPRRYVQPPNLDVLDENPLIRLAAWAADPEQSLFRVEVLRGANRPQPPPQPAPTPTPSDLVVVPADDPGVSATAEGTDGGLGAYDTRLRLAVLEVWDGITWQMSGDYRNAGRVLPPIAEPPGTDTAVDNAGALAPPLRIEERITVEQLQGRLMPAISAPHRVDGVRVAYDQSTGTLLRAAPLVPGVSYTVTSINHSVDVNLPRRIASGQRAAPLPAR
jgi:hypothetical protein